SNSRHVLFTHFSCSLLYFPSFPTRRSSDLLYFVVKSSTARPTERDISFTEMLSAVDQGKVSEVVIHGGDARSGADVRGKYKDNPDRKSTRLNSSHVSISYAVFCLKKKKSK